MNFEWTNEDEDVMARISNEYGEQVTILSAPRDTLGEDGPVVTQVSNDQVIVIFSDEFIQEKLKAAITNNEEDFGDASFAIGFTYLLTLALKTAKEKLHP